jgi:putative oxidoreductase
MHVLTLYSAPVGRVLLSLIFLLSGIQKLGDYAGSQQYMEAMGVPGILIIPTIALEIGGALAVMIGWRARAAALLLAGFCLATAAIFHSNFADQMQTILFLKNLAIAGGFLLIVAHGPGAFSLGRK